MLQAMIGSLNKTLLEYVWRIYILNCLQWNLLCESTGHHWINRPQTSSVINKMNYSLWRNSKCEATSNNFINFANARSTAYKRYPCDSELTVKQSENLKVSNQEVREMVDNSGKSWVDSEQWINESLRSFTYLDIYFIKC